MIECILNLTKLEILCCLIHMKKWLTQIFRAIPSKASSEASYRSCVHNPGWVAEVHETI